MNDRELKVVKVVANRLREAAKVERGGDFLDDMATRLERLVPKPPPFDHSLCKEPVWIPGIGPCVCLNCEPKYVRR
jgi:hypothetical protein